ncbi:hypothetical protein B9Z19DRAFT_897255, partial [Tuber borchii]
IVGMFYTSRNVNFASSFGPSVASRSSHHYHWSQWISIILGALLAGAFNTFIRILGYETANPGGGGGE